MKDLLLFFYYYYYCSCTIRSELYFKQVLKPSYLKLYSKIFFILCIQSMQCQDTIQVTLISKNDNKSHLFDKQLSFNYLLIKKKPIAYNTIEKVKPHLWKILKLIRTWPFIPIQQNLTELENFSPKLQEIIKTLKLKWLLSRVFSSSDYFHCLFFFEIEINNRKERDLEQLKWHLTQADGILAPRQLV